MPSCANPSKPFEKRLGSVDSELRSVNGKMVSLVPGPDFDLCLAQHLAESIGEFKSELVDITRGLSLLESDNATLSEWAVTIRNALSDSSLKLERMQFNQTSNMTSTSFSGVKLPKLEVSTFHGNITNWAAFWERFSALIHSRKGVDDVEKLTYLRQAFKDGPAWRAVSNSEKLRGSYQIPPRVL